MIPTIDKPLAKKDLIYMLALAVAMVIAIILISYPRFNLSNNISTDLSSSIAANSSVILSDALHYIDGRTPLCRLIRVSSNNKQWRKQVFERDHYTCQECFQRDSNLEVHRQL